jgi:DNA-binding NarL/FixJ family response regulator
MDLGDRLARPGRTLYKHQLGNAFPTGGEGSTAVVVKREGAVVVADSDGPNREALASALMRAGYETVEAETGAEALAALGERRVALVMLEVELPDMTGYEICSGLREDGRNRLAIFLLSGKRTDPIDRIAGLLLGADDFIVKPLDVNEVVVRVSRLVARHPVNGQSEQDASLPNLTAREQEILALVADGVRQTEIARSLSISQKTVATHIQNMLGKMGVHSRAELVARAYQLGIVVAGPLMGVELPEIPA